MPKPVRDQPIANQYKAELKGKMQTDTGLLDVLITGILTLVIDPKPVIDVEVEEPPTPTVPPLDTGKVAHQKQGLHR